ncbi:MAG: hypothetical protein K2K69_07470 [Muribaculaceae bacterium]|nr:hypothetical protein [Muribaculaceae bacterium]
MSLSFSNTFLQKEIGRYLERGFGSYNKNDFEVLIFKALLDGALKGKSNYEISRALQIPESKVKRLRYEVDLKYADRESYDSEKYLELDRVLTQAVWKGSSGKIQISIEDISLRKFLDNILKTHHSFSDSSFNSEVVTITPDDLSIIFSTYAGGREVIEKVDNILASPEFHAHGSRPRTFREVLPEIILELAKCASGVAKTAEGIVNLAPRNLLEKIGGKLLKKVMQ